MALVVPNEGELRLLDRLVSALSCKLRLFRNDITPGQSSVYADFTEANFSGYAEATPSFGAAATVSNKGTITDSSAREFTHNGGATANTIYGYYVVDSGASKLLWAERFASSQSMTNSGDKITITAKLTLNSEN